MASATRPSPAPRLVGAKRIIAVDTDNRKLNWAREFGATHTINARELDAVETIQDLTDGIGADVVIDAVGRPETWKQAFYARDLAGTVVLVGVPTPGHDAGDAADRLLLPRRVAEVLAGTATACPSVTSRR